MKNIVSKELLVAMILTSTVSCQRQPDNPLIVPPKFSELPDSKNPQPVKTVDNPQEIQRLKELLLEETD